MFKMLREVQLNIGVEKVNMHERVIVKVLLDNGITEVFMNRKIATKYGFRLQKLNRPMKVKNVDSINNSTRTIIHQVKVNIYYKNHIERIRIDMYDLEKTNMILEMLQLQIHNPKIN